MESLISLKSSRACLAAVLILASATLARADQALVAVAANFAGAAEALAAGFSTETGHSLQITTGSTGKLYAQIAEGAPFEVMLSADEKTPARLAAEHLGAIDSIFTYAVGKLTLWSKGANRIGDDLDAALTAPDTLFIAIANPDLAPYGIAARETLQAMGLWNTVQPKIVMGQNIGQTFAMVASGAAQVGFVVASALIGPEAPSGGSHYDIPQSLYTPIRQAAILLKPGQGNPAAEAFLDYLKGENARAIIHSFGYGSD